MSAMQTWTYPAARPKVSGPWDGEPDKAQWVDDATGLDCLIVRGPGALCGYVGVPASHVWHGRDYGQCGQPEPCDDSWCSHSPECVISVHGGLTFASGCDERETDGTRPQICHVPLPGRPGDVWWFGFDCAHAGDLTSYDVEFAQTRAGWPEPRGTYRDLAYVQAECTSLARQLAAVTR